MKLIVATTVVGCAAAFAPAARGPAALARRGAALRSASVDDDPVARICDGMKERAIMPAPVLPMLEGFFSSYIDCLGKTVADGPERAEYVDLLEFYAKEFENQLVEPFVFKPFHEAVTEGPNDYYELNKKFMLPLIDMDDSLLLGEDNFAKLRAQLDAGENVVMLSNHQTEADPSAFTALMDDVAPGFAAAMISVAGDRVTTDPVAVPFSKGRNLLCIYSKRHIENPPEGASKKKMHNVRTLGALQKLLQAGGRCIWVAPSGGRDRPPPDNPDAPFKVAPFDPKSVEMFRLMAAKAKATPTHFYPVAMLTHELIPPPNKVESGAVAAGGEKREARRASVSIAIGEELDLEGFEQGCLVDNFPEGCVPDRDATRQATTAHVFAQVQKAYDELIADTIKRDSPYYTRRADEPAVATKGGGSGGEAEPARAEPARARREPARLRRTKARSS